MITYLDRLGIISRLFRTLVLCITAFLLFQFISIYLNWPEQLVLGAATILLGLVINRFSASRVITLALMLISMTATLRYGWWRVHLLIDYFSDESNNRGGVDTVFIFLLITAEAYTVMIMFLGYMQTAWPLHRKPISMPADDSQWPHVDVLIPTYNEPLSLVRYTVLAAINIDYPPDKLHVYILDDGTREDYQEFSRQVGVGYITRAEHSHAKAGNINHALTTMHSPYVAIFDCDHVPTRSFLQMTMGWMLADTQLGMLQTPHHFYSPDPFERNLLQYKTIPNEGELFYGIVQDGNDFWNATFFCGSCALLRRSALDSVGGIAVETVTEDAHTSLRMQKIGYNTAYINIPQAAGLATETLSAHVGQRIRWARGMIQILRIDNPLFAHKMKFTQRLCYFNAMAHFLYAVPRLVFLLAPLVYLLLGRTIIPGYWVAILVYALPHLILASLTNSRIQGRHRHSFWNEIYEVVLAPYILMPTLLAFINPKLGKFNVTSKGNTLSKTRFDRKTAVPTEWLLLLNFIGMLAVPYRIYTDPQHTGAVIMNLVWIVFNMVILGVAAAVAHEQKQRRETVRIAAKIPVRIDLEGGRQIEGMSQDMSVGGAFVQMNEEVPLALGSSFQLAFPEQSGNAEVGAKILSIEGRVLRLSFALPTIAEQEILTRALYSRADAWISPLANKEVDRPLVSLMRIVRLSFTGIYQVLRSLIPFRKEPEEGTSISSTVLVLMALVLGGWSYARAASQAGNASARVTKPASSEAENARIRAYAEAARGKQIMSLKDMGQPQTIEMRGTHSYYSVHFTLSHSLVPRHATLKLIYKVDSSLDVRTTSLGLSLNGIAVATVPPMPSSGLTDGFAATYIPIPDALLVRRNTLTFEFTGSGFMQLGDQSKARIHVRISPASTLEVDGDRLPWKNNLSQLPLPIFDSELETSTTVPIVFLSQPSPKMLEAAGIVASWLGLQTNARPVRFTVSVGQIPAGNPIVFSRDPSLLPAAMKIPAQAGPLLALRANPSDSFGSVLVISGMDDDQLLTVARTLALSRSATATTPAEGFPLVSDTARIPGLVLPPARMPDDAPRWMPVSRGSPLASCKNPDVLESDGATPIRVYFHVPPGLYYGEEQNVAMHLHYRYNALPIAAGSALRVFVNGVLVNEVLLPPGKGMMEGQRVILVPIASLRPFGNTALFNFDFIPTNRQVAQNPVSTPLNGEIRCNSSLDLHSFSLWTNMPNLELFANAGFPFTSLADLAETTVVLPDVPSPAEIALYLYLMSHFGAQTGYPVLRVTVDGPNAVLTSGRSYLVLGSLADQPAFNALDPLLPVVFDSSGVHVKPATGYLANASSIGTAMTRWLARLLGRSVWRDLPSNAGGMPDAVIEEIRSPSSLDSSMVLIVLGQDSAAENFASVFLDRSQSTDISGSVSLLRNLAFHSYSLDGDVYHVGNITRYAVLRIWLTRNFLLLLFVVTALSLLVAYWVYGWLKWHTHERLKLAETQGSSK
jgi:cellulose synthase (UDP-forming)